MKDQHEYGDSFTGMLCGAMVTDADGFGDECGLPVRDPIHKGSAIRELSMGAKAIRERLIDGGFYDFPDEMARVRRGMRVRNRSEQYSEALSDGTANVVWVLRKEGSWEQDYGRKNLEVIVEHDDGKARAWADYNTEVVHDA